MSGLRNASWFDRPWFAPVVIVLLFLGNAFDLFGTYVHQPDFEDEVNPIYLTLRPHGFRLSWPIVIAGKLAISAIFAIGLVLFLKLRRHYYPNVPSTFRAFITHFIYGRPLGWIESCFKLPRSWTPALLLILAVSSLAGPYFASLGYANLASEYGWWRWGGIWVGRYWIDWGLPIWVTLATAWFCRQIWLDYRSIQKSGVDEANQALS